MNLRAGMEVTVSSAEHGPVAATVEEVTQPHKLPDLPGLPAETARNVLAEWEIRTIALISYSYFDQPRIFAALQTKNGRWYDLQRNHLTIVNL